MKRRKQTVKDEEKMVTIISNKDKPDPNASDLEFWRKDLEEEEVPEAVERWLEDVSPDDTDNIKESKDVDKKSKKNSVGRAVIDKTDSEICPVCGWTLVNAASGIWCVNPECEVLDDADNYRLEKTGSESIE